MTCVVGSEGKNRSAVLLLEPGCLEIDAQFRLAGPMVGKPGGVGAMALNLAL